MESLDGYPMATSLRAAPDATASRGISLQSVGRDGLEIGHIQGGVPALGVMICPVNRPHSSLRHRFPRP